MNIEIEKLLLDLVDRDNCNNLIEIEPLIGKCLSIDDKFHLTNIEKFYKKKFSKTHYVRTGYLRGDQDVKYYINILDINFKSGYYDLFVDSPIGSITTELYLRKKNKENEVDQKLKEMEKEVKQELKNQESKKKKNVLTEAKTVEIALYMINNKVVPDTKVCEVMVTKYNLENIIKIKMLIQDWINKEMKANNFVHNEQPKKVDAPAVAEQPKKKLSLFIRFVNFITLNGAKNVV